MFKGQIVYQICPFFATDYKKNIIIGTVIERQLDTAGKKRVTFFDRGSNDWVFGKSVYAEQFGKLLETREKAFEVLQEFFDGLGKKDYKYKGIIMKGEFTDANAEVFEYVEKFMETL